MIAGAPPRYRVRWVILAYLFGFAFVAYMQRTSFSVAAVQMMPELGISQIQLGWLMTAYLVTYTVFQLPGGVFGQWLGARKALVITGLVGARGDARDAAGTAVVHGRRAGVRAAALAPGGGRRACAAVPGLDRRDRVLVSRRPAGAVPNGLQTAGLQLGSAAATPLIALLMATYGWKQRPGVDQPAGAAADRAVGLVRPQPARRASRACPPPNSPSSATRPRAPPAAGINRRDLLRVLANRDVLLLTISYTIMNYVFYLLGSWSFLYLVQERHLSVPQSGLLGSLPFIAAAIGSGAGGKLADRWPCATARASVTASCRWSRCRWPGLLLFVGVEGQQPTLGRGGAVARLRRDRDDRGPLRGRDDRGRRASTPWRPGACSAPAAIWAASSARRWSRGSRRRLPGRRRS